MTEQYFAAQRENLLLARRRQPYAEQIPLMDKLYTDATGLIPRDRSPVFRQFLLVCHKSFLAAAALIGQGQPDDADPITRRAIEVARFAAVIRTNPEKAEDWISFDERMRRWRDRQVGKKPKSLWVDLGEVHPGIKPTVDDLMATHGILSDRAAHFTPEYLNSLEWEQRGDALFLNFLVKDQRTLIRAIILTCGTHLQILEVIDWCFDSAFRLDPDWFRHVETLRERGTRLTRD